MTTEANWKRVQEAPRGIGHVLLRIGAGSLDGVFVGYKDPDTGRWLDQESREVQPAYFALIPLFDCEDDQQ
ncbi:hypothetical protein [Bradyrhizobium sp. LTSP857]|uniref:hypothetical protein n=1 Tax=Bradyrhizobium sp. LTSP857 TaxID=1619231 RepID=UPI0012E0954F|nr:hypothetical protein [Bradyrhizobium sp. LTSP857]